MVIVGLLLPAAVGFLGGPSSGVSGRLRGLLLLAAAVCGCPSLLFFLWGWGCVGFCPFCFPFLLFAFPSYGCAGLDRRWVVPPPPPLLLQQLVWHKPQAISLALMAEQCDSDAWSVAAEYGDDAATANDIYWTQGCPQIASLAADYGDGTRGMSCYSPGPTGNDRYCKVCDLWLNGPVAYLDHRIGKKHKKNSRMWLIAQRAMAAEDVVAEDEDVVAEDVVEEDAVGAEVAERHSLTGLGSGDVEVDRAEDMVVVEDTAVENVLEARVMEDASWQWVLLVEQ